MNATIRHDTDFYGWTQAQTNLLRDGKMEALDVTHLIEELEDMGKSQQSQLQNRLEVLMIHLLKWLYQPEFQGNSWKNTIEEQRVRITKHIKKNPSLKHGLDEVFSDAYEYARYGARRETGMRLEAFPTECPWTFEQAMNPEFWPE